MKHLILGVFFLSNILLAQQLPLTAARYTKVTSYDELTSYIKTVTDGSILMHYEVIAKSVEGREIFGVFFSKGSFGTDAAKIKVLIFCQQHGNEQSGKEGALMLLNELRKPENDSLFKKIDLVLIPQMNPDGSEKNARRNGHGMDLNRNHLILTEPETIGLHKLFDRYLFDVTMDVHEYYPYGESWKAFGYRSNNDVEVGVTTNSNVSEKIRTLSKKEYLPYIERYLKKAGATYFEYSPGGPPEKEYIRHSTFDINDGRQSFGVQNTFSLIQEGMNGYDVLVDNLKHRSETQMAGMKGLLEYTYSNAEKIKKLIAGEREKLLKGNAGSSVAIQLDHFPDGTVLSLPLLSYATGKDTIVQVKNYKPVVKPITTVARPKGYVIPKSLPSIITWLKRHDIAFHEYRHIDGMQFEQYYVNAIDSMDFEGDMVVNPVITVHALKSLPAGNEYVFVPMKQLKANVIATALEPKSELGLVTYKQYETLLKKNEHYPILRVIK